MPRVGNRRTDDCTGRRTGEDTRARRRAAWHHPDAPRLCGRGQRTARVKPGLLRCPLRALVVVASLLLGALATGRRGIAGRCRRSDLERLPESADTMDSIMAIEITTFRDIPFTLTN